jgi:23S rRNA maturation mini-RNase III
MRNKRKIGECVVRYLLAKMETFKNREISEEETTTAQPENSIKKRGKNKEVEEKIKNDDQNISIDSRISVLLQQLLECFVEGSGFENVLQYLDSVLKPDIITDWLLIIRSVQNPLCSYFEIRNKAVYFFFFC